jgi:hypothetical protein
MISVNQAIITGYIPIALDPSYTGVLPKVAAASCLSFTDAAPWTNRTPEHEPWPRVVKCDTPNGGANDQVNRNTSHIDQFIDDGGQQSASIGRIEGIDMIPRGPFWRR